jgi:hypothetical protein
VGRLSAQVSVPNARGDTLAAPLLSRRYLGARLPDTHPSLRGNARTFGPMREFFSIFLGLAGEPSTAKQSVAPLTSTSIAFRTIFIVAAWAVCPYDTATSMHLAALRL